MKKTIRVIIYVVLICSFIAVGGLFKDKLCLRNNLIRLHVVANSDNEFDQTVKLKVRDAIVDFLRDCMVQMENVEDAKAYLMEQIPTLEAISDQVLSNSDLSYKTNITLKEECFDKRVYDTFSLPSGVYQSLRIELGAADGKNWWCVVFPSLCLPATGAEFRDTAVSSGFDDDLADTLSKDSPREIRFFFLDCLGKIENFFHLGE